MTYRKPTTLFLTSVLVACGAPEPGGSFDQDIGGKSDDASSSRLTVNEIAAHPDFDVNGDGRINSSDEYLELLNTGRSEIDLTGVAFEDRTGTRFTFPDGATLPGRHAALVMAKPGTFVAPEGAVVFDAGRLGLNDDGDKVLIRRGDTVIENHGFSMPRSERRSWNRTIDGFTDGTFTLTAASPGTRQDGSLFGSSILSDEQMRSVLLDLDNECPDTFCGGDFGYWLAEDSDFIDCQGTGHCTVGLRVNPAVDDKFDRDVLDGKSPLELIARDPGGAFVGRAVGTSTFDTGENEKEVFVNVECELRGLFLRASDVAQPNGDPTDEFRDALLDCLTGNDGLDAEVLPGLDSYRGLLTPFERDALLLALHEECPDTFCGGDFSFFLVHGVDGTIQCENDGLCTVGMAVTPFADEFTADPLAGMSAADLTATSPSGEATARVVGSKSRDGETAVTLECDLRQPTWEAPDIFDQQDEEATELFRDLFLDCISAAENNVLPNLATM